MLGFFIYRYLIIFFVIGSSGIIHFKIYNQDICIPTTE
jgi:hypothetical protein